MTNQEILTKAIGKAIAGGWKGIGKLRIDEDGRFIFNHDFAKALWGDEHVKYVITCTCHGNENFHSMPRWQHNLQQMVIADDPIKYLGENI